MGANAQTTVPDFVADTVLTAAKLDISAATGVPVFATTVTRDAAFGGANKVLAEGQTCYLESTNVVQYYDGAAWATVGPAAASPFAFVIPSSVAVGSGSGSFNATTGLTTFSGASSISLNGVFTSTYTRYQLIMRVALSAAEAMTLRWRVGGINNSLANYSTTVARSMSNGTFAQVTTSESATSHLAVIDTAGAGANYQSLLKMEIINPQQTSVTSASHDFTVPNSVTTIIQRRIGAVEYNATTSFDGLSFICGGAVTATGTVQVLAYVE